MSLTAAVCCAASHDPGHHDSPRAFVPTDGGALRQRQSRQAPRKHPQTSDSDPLNPKEPPHFSLCPPQDNSVGTFPILRTQ